MSATPDAEHDDNLADALALTEAIRRDDGCTGLDVCVILRYGDAAEIAVTLAKLLTEAAMELNASPDHVRHWSAQAVRRP